MKIEISHEAFNALVQEYDKYMDLYDLCNEETCLQDRTNSESSSDDFLKEQAFCSLFETIGMVIAEVVEEGLDDWCEQNHSVMEAALRESQPLKEIV